MSKKEYAVEGMTFKFENPSHSGDVSVIPGQVSQVNKFDGKGAYKDNLSILISNGDNGSDISSATGSGTISATSQKNSSEGQKLLRDDDESNEITMTGTNANPPPPTLTYTTKVIIDDPGQDVARGE